jgi:hypothetical protein
MATFAAFVVATNKLKVDGKSSRVCVLSQRRRTRLAAALYSLARAHTHLTRSPRVCARAQVPGIGAAMETKLEARGITTVRTRTDAKHIVCVCVCSDLDKNETDAAMLDKTLQFCR